MKLLEYYKKNLSENVIKVEELYCSLNSTNDTSGNEFYDRITYAGGAQEYYLSTFEMGHSLERPIDFPLEWLEKSLIQENNNLEIPDFIDDILEGKGW